MAITLSIELTDQEQARLLEIANTISPGSTPAEIKTWAEKKAKQGLRQIVVNELTEYQNQVMETDWPAPLEVPPPQSP